MMPNGFVGSWMLVERGGDKPKILATGLTEASTEDYGRRYATERGYQFVRVTSWRDAPDA